MYWEIDLEKVCEEIEAETPIEFNFKTNKTLNEVDKLIMQLPVMGKNWFITRKTPTQKELDAFRKLTGIAFGYKG